MAEEKMVVITMLRGEFIAPAWREEGTVLEVEQAIADRWVKFGSAKLGGELAGGNSQQNAPDLGAFAEFPGSEQFVAAGITSIEGVKQLIEKHGDAWAKEVKGIGKAIAAKVSEALEALSKPAEPEKTETN